MVARAMLPAGFMPTVEAAGVKLALCGGGALSQGDEGAPADARHGDSICPFAQASGAAPLPGFTVLVPLFERAANSTTPRAQVPISFGPPRLHRVRGPPSFV